MHKNGEPSATKESADQAVSGPEKPAPQTPRTIGPPNVHVIPVDAHRVFAHWYVPQETLVEAIGGPAGEMDGDARLTLRVFDVASEGDQRETSVREDFPATGGWHEGFITLGRPGGSIMASIGVTASGDQFSPIASSTVVTLPEAPASPAFKPKRTWTAPPKPPPVFARPEPPPLPPPPVRAPTPALDEKSILSAALGPESLLPELRALPVVVVPAPERPQEMLENLETPPGVPLTHMLDERAVVFEALNGAAGALQEATAQIGNAADGAPRDANAASTGDFHRLASNFDTPVGAAPVRLKATMVISGRVRRGHGLRIGNKEIEPNPGGTFTYTQPLHGFGLAWQFLAEAASPEEPTDVPSLELLARIPEPNAPLTMRASVEIEGELSDPAYLQRLPAGINVDSAGRFRLSKPLPAGAWFLPHLILLSHAEAGV